MITMEIRIGKPGSYRWTPVGPTRGQPYTYDTVAAACDMLSICYPDQVREARLGADPVVRVSCDQAYIYPSHDRIDRTKYPLIPDGWVPRLA